MSRLSPPSQGRELEQPGELLDNERIFFAFAHDLRFYLRTVLTRIQLVQRSAEAILPGQDQLALADAESATREIDGLVNAMSRFYGSSSVDGSIDLSVLLRGLLVEHKAKFEKAGWLLNVATNLDCSVPAALKWVLTELLANSSKFRSPERPLRVLISSSYSLSNGNLEICVSDNGMGVDPEFLGRMFLPFHRLHSRAAFPGYGLGLATCRRVAENWGGAISARLSPEAGLTILLTVPASIEA